jgi:RNA polymerase sigma factor (TIGR02999 family)
LVHEAYIRLVGAEKAKSWESRGHFFAAAAEAMRRILVENARRRQRVRHGGALQRVDAEGIEIAGDCPEDKVLLVNEALEALAAEDPLKARVVTLHYLAGLNGAETAEALGVSEKTVQRYWAFAKVWLYDWIQNASQR